ncbi:MAG: helicase-exonuclease AddAB subunit AddA [Syntrophomonadaceae bacterium]
MPDWTSDQLSAIEDRNHNLLVAAAAGAGKTAVLVERIVRLVLDDGIDLDRMLIVTFTQAAAGEMRSRISGRLLEEMDCNLDKQSYLLEQLSLLNRATISTLHSFCLEVVKKNFHLVDIDPNFRVGDQTECALVKLDVLEELMEEEYASGEPEFLRLVEMFGTSKDDQPLQDLILRTYEFVQSQPEPLAWLRNQVDKFAQAGEDLHECPWIAELRQQLGGELSGLAAVFQAARETALQPGGPGAYLQALDRDLETVEKLNQKLSAGIDDFYDQLELLQFTKLVPAGKDTDQHLRDEAKSLREQGKKLLRDIKESYFFQSPADFSRDMAEMHLSMEYLYGLVAKFSSLYRQHKAERGILDFNDLEHLALRILADIRAANSYQQRYSHIFVDEYQDSNLVQETILDRIRSGDNLFLVGDVKQSIYRFRLADPDLFMHKHRTYPKDGNSADKRIDLLKNFRSRPEIISGINHIFSKIMSKEMGEIEYDRESWLSPGIELPEGIREEITPPALELLLIDQQAAGEEDHEEDGEDNLAEISNVEVEALQAASSIQQLRGQSFYDTKLGSCRPLQYRDMVVLMRATRSQAEVYYDTLTAAGIPVYADVDRGYFQALEINIFINLLKLIDNKRQDLPLLSVLRSPIGGFSLDDLIAVRSNRPNTTFFEALESYVEEHSDELGCRLQEFIRRLRTWKEESRIMEIDEFIWMLMLDTGYYHYVGAMPGGQQRQANLRILLERAGQFQTTAWRGLFHFLQFIAKVEAGSSDMGMAKILGENEDVVRIMSIHKSKGLEFPVVIVAGLGRNFNTRDTSAPVLFHKDLGLGPRYINPELRTARDTLARIAMKNAIRLESLAEEMRILYVACTRPRDRLILLGSVRNLERQVNKWSRAINPFQLSRARSFLDWLGPVVLRHPGGEKLRELICWNPANPAEEVPNFNWRLQIISRRQLTGAESFAAGTNLAGDGYKELPAASPQQELIWSRLNWEYPYPEAAHIPSKISVSQLKEVYAGGLDRANQIAGEITPQPGFMNESGQLSFSGATRGSIVHTVMQHLDLDRIRSAADVQAQLEELVAREILRPEETQAIEPNKIMNFFNSDLGRRLLHSPRTYREVPFNLVFKAGRVFAGLETSEEELLLQGIIDLCFHEDGHMILVDYKTDRVTPQNRQEIIERYRIQLSVYREALEKIKMMPVKESYIYLFDSEEAVKID